tara:strand:+ start:274 stop:483 length:210 start_codon:yes stop_codon:yes gene_type:complete
VFIGSNQRQLPNNGLYSFAFIRVHLRTSIFYLFFLSAAIGVYRRITASRMNTGDFYPQMDADGWVDTRT